MLDDSLRLHFLCCQVHITHVGQMRFKGVAEIQSVMQFSTAHLAARQFPAEPPSAKAELVTASALHRCTVACHFA